MEEKELTGNTRPPQSLEGHLKAPQEGNPCNKHDEEKVKSVSKTVQQSIIHACSTPAQCMVRWFNVTVCHNVRAVIMHRKVIKAVSAL